MEDKGFCTFSVEEMLASAVKYHLETYDWRKAVLTGEDALIELMGNFSETKVLKSKKCHDLN